MFLCLAFIQAQDKTQIVLENSRLVEEECGEFASASEGNFYETTEGKIVKIVDGKTVIFEGVIENDKEKHRFFVDLAGIEASKVTRKFLEEKLLNEKVSVKKRIFGENDRNRFVIVYGKTAKLREINCFMIRNGIAKYKKFKGKSIVPDSKPYYYLKAEEKAKEEKLGIWAK